MKTYKNGTMHLSADELNAIISKAVEEALSAKAPKAAKAQKPRKAKAEKPQNAEFKQMTDSVYATGYLPHAVYVWNKAEAEKLGGTVGKSAHGFFEATFPTVAKATKFAKVATYDIPDKEYKSIVQERTKKAQEYKQTQASKSVDNKALAAEMRALGLTPNGEAWAYAKAHGAKAAAKKFGK